MKKTIKIIEYTTIIFAILIYLLTIFNSYLSINYLDSLVFFLLLTSFIYICGIFINEEKTYKMNINIYFILYLIMLLSLTMFIRRPSISINIHAYFSSLNLIPFKTINSYIRNCLSDSIAFYNIFGNLIVLMPLSFLIMLKDDKNINIKNQTIKLTIMVIIIELLQFIFNCGIFDIDDFILNIGGSLLFYIIISRTKLIYKIRKIFYQDYKLNDKYKYILVNIFGLIELVILASMTLNIIKTL